MIPVGDSPRRRRTPYVTWGILIANVVVFVFMATRSDAIPQPIARAEAKFIQQTDGICYGFQTAPTEIDRFYCRWSFQPQEWFDGVRDEPQVSDFDRLQVLFTIITSTFMHAGFLHIFGNMLFLWVFADNVEDRFGHLGFALFYVASGVAASLTQGAMDPESVVPNVGASGAVAGVLGAYLVYFFSARVRIVIPIFPLFFFPFAVPAVVMIGVWFAQNLISGYLTLGDANAPDGGVAWFAHIGGFVFGAAIALLLRAFEPRRRVPAWS